MINKDVELAKMVVITFLKNNTENLTVNDFYEIYQINSGDKKLLLEHLKTLYEIFGNAIEFLEKNNKD